MKMTDEELAASAKRAVNCLSDQTRAEMAAGLFSAALERHTREICAEFFLAKAADKTGKSMLKVAAKMLVNDDLRKTFLEFVDEAVKGCKTDLLKAAGMTKPENQ